MAGAAQGSSSRGVPRGGSCYGAVLVSAGQILASAPAGGKDDAGDAATCRSARVGRVRTRFRRDNPGVRRSPDHASPPDSHSQAESNTPGGPGRPAPTAYGLGTL